MKKLLVAMGLILLGACSEYDAYVTDECVVINVTGHQDSEGV